MAAWDPIWCKLSNLLHQEGLAAVAGVAPCYVAGNIAGDAWCRQENGSVYELPTELDFEVQNILAQQVLA